MAITDWEDVPLRKSNSITDWEDAHPNGTVDLSLGPVVDAVKNVGNMTKAGYAGMADLIAGNGLKKSVESIGHVRKGEDTTSAASTIGSAIGSQFTPAQVAMQAAGGKIAEMVGPAIAGLLKGWGEKAAINAVGMIKSMAEKFGLGNLDELAQFLLKPITFGGKTYSPIVTATSSTADMLKAAKEIQSIAGKQLEVVSKAVDDSIPLPVPGMGGTSTSGFDIVDLPALQSKIGALRDEFSRVLPGLGKPVIEKYQTAFEDIEKLIATALKDGSKTIFADLAAARSRVGSLAFEHSGKTESTAALQKIYWAMADTLRDAAAKTSVGTEYAQANLVYHQVSAVVEALTGKATKFAVKDLFAPGAMSFIGSIIGGLPGMIAGGLVGAASNAYGHQAVARGLNALSPVAEKGIEIAARGIPVAGRAIADALQASNRE